MKKILIVILVLALRIGGVAGLLRYNSLSFSTGRCLIADNGSVLLIVGSSPMVLSGRDGLFEGLSTGDEIRVLHDGVRESYPAQTAAYYVTKVASGTIEDIPADVIANLASMGWIS